MVLLAACWTAGAAKAGPAGIDAAAHATLDRFFYDVRSSRELANRAAGILVFPAVVKAGFGFGAEYGEGALSFEGGQPDIIIRSRVRSAFSSGRRRDPSSSCS